MVVLGLGVAKRSGVILRVLVLVVVVLVGIGVFVNVQWDVTIHVLCDERRSWFER